MRYKIGDVSKYLNLSDQMIRYYEKCGVIYPQRGGNGKYRYYSEMDVFLLFDAMRYKEWDINISDVRNLIEDDYFNNIVSKLEAFNKKLESKITYEKMLHTRIKKIESQIRLCQYNVGNYWVEEIEEKMLLFSGTAKGDCYDLTQTQQDSLKEVYAKKNISFFDVFIEFERENEQWWYSIDRSLYEALDIKTQGKVLEKQMCLCTIVDMGVFGEFNKDCINCIMAYMKSKLYKKSGNPFGIIIGRGTGQEKYRRLMQLYVPIETL